MLLACLQLNAWAVYNWENSGKMTQKYFILSCAKEMLMEDPEHLPLSKHLDLGEGLSPAAASTTPADRFHCRGEEEASIARSRKYK